MPASTARQVVIDDNNPRIQYTGGWELHDSNSLDTTGNSGPTLDSTLHAGKANGTFTFNFAGTSVDVFGTMNTKSVTQDWRCSVDESDIDAYSPQPLGQSSENNLLFCSAQNLTDSLHKLTVTVNADVPDTVFFDYLRYTPSNSEDLNTALVFMPFNDPDIGYRGSWTNFDNGTITDTQGSDATILFTGVSAQWYGTLSPGFSTTSSQVSYSIDGGPLQMLTLDWPTKSRKVQLLNQRILQTPVLPPGAHNLTMQFDSLSVTSIPLSLTYLLVQNGTSVLSAPSSSSSTTATPLVVSSLSSARTKVNVAAIVGILLGSLLFLCLLVFLLFLYRRRRTAKWEPTILNPFKHRRSIPRPIETGSISTLNLFGTSVDQSFPAPAPVSHRVDRPPEASGSRPGPRDFPLTSDPANLDENASYYGGYQTWGQAKALEAAAGSRQRDSYI